MKDEKVILEKIVALQKDFISARREFCELTARAKEKYSELDATSLELKAALKDSRIGDKSIRNTENEIAVLKKKISEMDSDLEFIDQELKRTDDEAEALSAKKSDFVEKLAATTSRLQQTMDAFRKKEEERREIFSAIEAAKVEKTALTTEISGMLSTAVVQKEQNEKELDAFSMDFGKMAMEREEVKRTLEERAKILSPLRDEIAVLEGKCAYMEEVVLLEKQKALLETRVKQLEEETRTGSEKANGMGEALSRKEAELKLILSERTEKEALVETLSNEVRVFDDLAVKAKQSEDQLGEADSLIEQAISDLKELFAGSSGHEREFGLKMGLSSRS
ncbi:MAG TPA: hypothetical protein HPP58_00195 [Deltaproteobacteria bacterium]|nr:hypothetical protein [Deltaproteobacteria bacterium]HIJ35661.1 hypothetical protein [Deltaproteobacteria bacterium]HIJ39464.1 hypothetical protein [Deltaproteobacteria bacterium]